MTTTSRVVTGTLHRVQRGHGKSFVAAPPPGVVHRPARVAVMLALAHKIREGIEGRRLQDQAEVRGVSALRAPVLRSCSI